MYPPYSTHSLQLLDVVLFRPLSKHYTKELTQHLQRTQGLLKITKQDFYRHFWPAWSSTMTHDLIVKSFQAVGVWPMDASQQRYPFSVAIPHRRGTLSRLINCFREDPLPAVGDADKEALLIHIVRVALFNLMFSHLRVQQVEIQLIFTLVVSKVTLTIHTGVPFGDELIGMTVLKPGNLAI